MIAREDHIAALIAHGCSREEAERAVDKVRNQPQTPSNIWPYGLD